MKISEYIFRLTKTKKIKSFKSDFPKFELIFPDGWRQMKITEPYAFYHEISNCGLTLYFYENNAKTRKVYAQLLFDTYGIEINEDDFEKKFDKEHATMKLIVDSDKEYSERVLKLMREHAILIDICLAGHPKDKNRTIELFIDWEDQIKDVDKTR